MLKDVTPERDLTGENGSQVVLYQAQRSSYAAIVGISAHGRGRVVAETKDTRSWEGSDLLKPPDGLVRYIDDWGGRLVVASRLFLLKENRVCLPLNNAFSK